MFQDTYAASQNREYDVSHLGRTYYLVITPITDADYSYIYGVDVTEERSSKYEQKKLFAAIEQSVSITYITDIDGVIEYVNPMFESITGFSKEEAIGNTPKILSSGDTPIDVYEDLWSTVLAGKMWRRVIKNKKKNGDPYWCNTAVSPIKNEQGVVTNFLSVQEDITTQIKTSDRIKYLASHDETSGLINRSRFIILLKGWISMAEDTDETGVLLIVGIDRFKVMNNIYGYAMGDEYLKGLAGTLDHTLSARFADVYFNHRYRTYLRPYGR